MAKSVFLSELNNGVFAYIDKISAPADTSRRLRDMGLMNGVKVYISSKAPMGDPIVVSLESFDLSLRLDMAKYISVRVEG